jgi:hypothetical protein
MRIKLIIKDDNDRRILQNAENTARRVEQWPAWKRNSPEESRAEQVTPKPRQTNDDPEQADLAKASEA